MSPARLSTEMTVRLEVSLPKSMKDWLCSQPRSASALLRAMIKRAMKEQKRRDAALDELIS